MKRAEADVAGSAPFEMYEVAYHLYYVGGIKNTLNCARINFSHGNTKLSNFGDLHTIHGYFVFIH